MVEHVILDEAQLPYSKKESESCSILASCETVNDIIFPSLEDLVKEELCIWNAYSLFKKQRSKTIRAINSANVPIQDNNELELAEVYNIWWEYVKESFFLYDSVFSELKIKKVFRNT